jgi:hypothetical protein
VAEQWVGRIAVRENARLGAGLMMAALPWATHRPAVGFAYDLPASASLPDWFPLAGLIAVQLRDRPAKRFRALAVGGGKLSAFVKSVTEVEDVRRALLQENELRLERNEISEAGCRARGQVAPWQVQAASGAEGDDGATTSAPRAGMDMGSSRKWRGGRESNSRPPA